MYFTAALAAQRQYFQSGATRPLAFRRRQLEKLSAALERHEAPLLAALAADLRKSAYQAYATELGVVQAEIRTALKCLTRWATPLRRRTSWFVAPARGWVQAEPFGRVLIIGPWNYPLNLLLTPLVSAIAAGNCAVLKPSELAPRTAEAVAALVRETFAEEFVSVVNGGVDVAAALLAERFDKIFFTGSTRVGRAVMAAAAKHLTPVTLELGGKCPAIVCSDADIELAAKRIAWGKFMNAGQTCVAPDFVLVQRAGRERFVAALINSLRTFYGDDVSRSPDYGRIVNDRHFARLGHWLWHRLGHRLGHSLGQRLGDLGSLDLRLGHMRLGRHFRLAGLRLACKGRRHLDVWRFNRTRWLLGMVHNHPRRLASYFAFILHSLRQAIGPGIINSRAWLRGISRRLYHGRSHRFGLIGQLARLWLARLRLLNGGDTRRLGLTNALAVIGVMGPDCGLGWAIAGAAAIRAGAFIAGAFNARAGDRRLGTAA